MDDLVPIYFPEENVLIGNDLIPIYRQDGGVFIGDTRYRMRDMKLAIRNWTFGFGFFHLVIQIGIYP